MSPTIAISTLIQFYEEKIIEENLHSLSRAIDNYDIDNLILDFCININQDLEKTNGNIKIIEENILNLIDQYIPFECYSLKINEDKPIGIGEYRRKFNDKYKNSCDILYWNESDCLVPSQAFNLINLLNTKCRENKVEQWIAFFGTNRMWDVSWAPIEHKEFRNKLFDPESTDNLYDLCHVVTYDEMEEINNVPMIDIDRIWPPIFNGCQLILSSSVIRSGINIPESMFFMREDTALMQIIRQHPEIHQYVFSNIYGPHNRKHPKKRWNIAGEENVQDKSKIGKLRGCHDWYQRAEKAMDENLANLFNSNYKAKEWSDILK